MSSVAVQTHDRNICIINFIFHCLSIFKNNYFFFDIPLNRCRVRRKKCWARTWQNNGCGYTYTHIHHHDSVHDPLIKKKKLICTERNYLSWTCLNPNTNKWSHLKVGQLSQMWFHIRTAQPLQRLSFRFRTLEMFTDFSYWPSLDKGFESMIRVKVESYQRFAKMNSPFDCCRNVCEGG